MKKIFPLLLCLFLLSCTQVEERQSIESPSEKIAPYSWIGQYSLQAGQYELSITGKEKTRIGLLRLGEHLHNLQEAALELMEEDFHLTVTKEVYPLSTSAVFTLDPDEQKVLKFSIKDEGNYAIVTEKLPNENKLSLLSSTKKELTPRHEHFVKGDSSEVLKCCAGEHGEYAWMGSFKVEEADYLLSYSSKEDITIGLAQKDASPSSFSHEALHVMAKKKKGEDQLSPSETAYLLPAGEHEFPLSLEKGKVLIILSHKPEEINFQFQTKDGVKIEPEETYIP